MGVGEIPNFMDVMEKLLIGRVHCVACVALRDVGERALMKPTCRESGVVT